MQNVFKVLLMIFGVIWAGMCFAADEKKSSAPAPAQRQQGATPSAGAAAPQQVQNAGASLHPVTTAFSKAGAKRCLGRVQQVMDFVTTGTARSGAYLFTPGANLDKDNSVLSASLEVLNGNVLSYVTAGFHPRQANDCGGLYEAVTYWQNACKDVAAVSYSQLKPAGFLQSQIQILEGPGAMRVFLMPAGAGCVAIKKEVIY